MATFIPVIGSCISRMTSGERRTAERLEQKLDSDYLLWYDVTMVGVGQMPAQGEDEREEARLFYVGATRATQRLLVGLSGAGQFASRFAA